ncbi:uncharacterized protein JCM10292_003338 [Rhodotorula paludigena]|uniref:uncharacterized protein n=1 Tax=Rhodotorula paludigena TaxID=86838 RepID=UPI00316B4A2B
MSSDTASVLSYSSTTPLTAPSTPMRKTSSLLSKMFKRSPSPAPSEPLSAEDTFREIMHLNARHGHPSVQAYSVPTASPKSPSQKKPAKRTPSSPTPAPSAQDAFDEIMRLNAKHGHPSIQAHFVR